MPTPPLARYRLVAAAVLALGLLAGCGSAKPVTVTGKLVLPAKLKIQETDQISITFFPEDGDVKNTAGGKSASGTVNPKDLTFTASVLPGKYKIGVGVTPYAGMGDEQKRTEIIDGMLGAFNATATPLRYEVTSAASQSITIDVPKSTVTSP